MKSFYITLGIAVLLGACSSSRYNTNPTTGSVEKLIKQYNKKPEDTLALQKLVTSYNLLNRQYLLEIDELKAKNTAQSWESAAGIYNKLNDLSINTAKNSELADILKPQNYTDDIAYARLQSADLYYYKATGLLDADNWRDARSAYSYFGKVKNIGGNYKDVNQLLTEAKAAGTLDIVVQPLRSEGLFSNVNYLSLQRNQLAEQLVNDMGGSWNSNQWYRTYTANNYNNNSVDPDWVAEPVWTNWRISPVQSRTYKREVSKQIETGKDSLKRPIYKTVRAVLTITETSLQAEGTMELRIADVKTQSSAGRTSWTENYIWKQSFATFKGDEDALSNEDLNLVRKPKERVPGEDKMQLLVMQKIYPDMLRWFRSMAD